MAEPTPTPNLDDPQSYDAQQMVEEIAAGEQETLDVDVAEDYEASQAFATSDTAQAEARAQAPTAAAHKQSRPATSKSPAESTGDPADFMEMAQEVTPDEEDRT